jgi:hypothetical protein
MRYLITDHTGHSVEEFDTANNVGMEEAQKRFAELTGQGMRAAVPSAEEPTPKIIKDFDPNAEEVTFVRPIVGG